jgi:RNA polymerase sigma factor (sigma-70 family)
VSSGPEFDEFFRRDLVPLIAFLSKAGFEREDARDAASEAMACAFWEWKSVQQPRAWVRKVAFRIAARQAQRSRESRLRMTERSRLILGNQQVDQMADVDQRLRVLDLLDGLPPQQRVVMAWHLDGYSTSEIAEHMEIAVATVRSTLRHARHKLAVKWRSEGGEGNGSQR